MRNRASWASAHGELRGQALRVAVMPGADSEARLYEDDGETRAYAQGMSVPRVFRHQTTADKETIAIGRARRTVPPAGAIVAARPPRVAARA